ncbi:hypothetical protein C900_05567 [Fulvivirga imtechensis AK7]|uniref:Uncharacterized protein n=1 Tax=Fulvivirga imtechensis AK7 TaxID=1237149 RepID=L8JN95_9BACT|nr:hypothetical protein [Fulvivirga imtechensis]ELR69009.1 hypothetical protein C900_05567 [Fulvivirga imtechensis AK7]
MKDLTMLALALIFTNVHPISAQNTEVRGNAAYIFAYYPKENAREHFENGYKKHLSWHAAKNDPLVWYAWYVQTGDRLGLFIDGTFGISHGAFDNRIAPAEDGQDFQETTAPYVDNAFRKVYTLKPELSTAQLLEEHTPSKMIEVYDIVVHPGAEARFETTISSLKKALDMRQEKPRFTVYKLLSGGEQSGYLIMVPRENAAYFDEKMHFTSISELVTKVFPVAQASALNQDIVGSVKHIKSETWGYRADLSLIPQ